MLFHIYLVAIVLLLLAIPVFGPGRVAFAIIMIGLLLYPREYAAASSHVGIAGPSPDITTFGLSCLIAGAIAVCSSRGRLSFYPVYPFVGFLVIASLLFWSLSPEQEAGIEELLTGALAWVIGSYFAVAIRSGKGLRPFCVRVLAAFCGVQFALTCLQSAGVVTFKTNSTTLLAVGGRVGGTFDHPDTLGKALFFAVALVLPIADGLDRRTRKWRDVTVAACLFGTVLTGARADLVALLCLLLLWFLTSPRGLSLGHRAVGSVLVLGAASAVFFVLYENRVEDVSAGPRAHLMGVALNLLPHVAGSGIGPNSYVTFVGAYDAMTASGYPVHDTFVLAAVELGIPGALLLFLPLMFAVWRAWFCRKEPSVTGCAARAIVAMVPGVIVIGVTGWGLLDGAVLPLMMFTFSMLCPIENVARRDRRPSGHSSRKAKVESSRALWVGARS
jgi:hypothetical protein